MKPGTPELATTVFASIHDDLVYRSDARRLIRLLEKALWWPGEGQK